ncbi:MAG: hypothetical protein HY305_04910 [Sphingobacteriales bacterium]|nr:hypothetical protein [Sphingobacteriales bacterium]
MSLENYPSADPSPEYVLPEQKKEEKKTGLYIIIALVAVLLATWGYMIWDKGNTTDIITKKNSLIDSANLQKDTLQGLLNDATARYDILQAADIEKDSTISRKDREIAETADRINSILAKNNATSHELAEARRLIKSLNKSVDSYAKQIQALKNQNAQLTQEKQTVTEDRDRIQKDFDSTKTVVKDREDIISVGSTLHTSNFNISAVNEKSNGKEKQTTRAKNADKLVITFDLDENRIALTGAKQLYVIITAPDGKPLSVEAMGSGMFSTRQDGEKIFSKKVEIAYTQGKKQTVTVDWKGSNFQTGEYKIEVYQNGFKIGEGTTTLKKGGLFG